MTSGPAAPARSRSVERRLIGATGCSPRTPPPAFGPTGRHPQRSRAPPPTEKPHARVPGRDHHRHPRGADSAEVDRRRAVEAVRAKVPAATGNLFRLWHSVGEPRSIGVWRAATESLVRGPR
ncbi:muconolactone Delta-isomerase family protein [Streptomyces sp. NBC_01637]|uniref:muconolactone Delta-isomerase family protein n=1 Tax=unclassified Streptomyces TaxID=2593676 RepID=UPI003864EFF3